MLDVGCRIGGQMLGMLLADQGAAVTRVVTAAQAVPPPESCVWNRGKRLVSLGATAPLAALIAASDIVITDDLARETRPGLDEASLRAARPDVISCDIPALPGGVALDAAEADALVGAMTAVHQPDHANASPLYNALPLPSVLAATRAAAAVAAALAARDRDGAGRSVEVSLYEAMLLAWGRHLVKLGAQEDIGVVPRLPLLRQYQCADGRYVQLHGNFETRWSRIFLQVAGHPEYIAEAAEIVRSGSADPTVQRTWLDRITAYMRTRPAAEWESQLNDAGGAAAMSRTVEEWLVHEHARAAGIVVDVPGTPYGTMTQPGVAVTVGGGAAREGPAPAVTSRRALPLSGVRVLDLTILIAGPTCGRTLAELGAEVVKIDDPHRVPSIHSWMDTNRGKRSLLLDLKATEGREVFWRLLETADVVVTNYRKGKLEKLGLGYDDLIRRRPNLVYASINAFGADGPWAGRAGWEQIVQAASGHQVRRGGRGRVPLVVTPWVCDYTAGLLAAFGVALAMHDRSRGGGPRQVQTSLAASGALVQSRYFFDYPGYARAEIEAEALGESALSRLYEARDGWLYLDAAEPGAWGRLLRVREFASLAAAEHRADLAERIAAIFRTEAKAYWLSALADAGVAVVERRTLADLRDGRELWEKGLLVSRPHEVYGSVRYVDTRLRWSDAAAPDLGAPRAPGQDSRAVLRTFGYSDDEIERLIRGEVVGEHVLSIRETGV